MYIMVTQNADMSWRMVDYYMERGDFMTLPGKITIHYDGEDWQVDVHRERSSDVCYNKSEDIGMMAA